MKGISKKVWVVVGIIAVMGLVGAVIESTDSGGKQTTQTQIQVSPTTTPAIIEKFDIQVTSVIVKKVDSKYRYFFSIKNADTKDFSGTVVITLFNSKGNRLAEQTFTAESQKAELSSSVYLDANTSPEGEFGISKFKFVAQNANKQEVAKGDGAITGKFESL